MPSCVCDRFLNDWVTSTADGVRPPTWRRLSEDPGAHLAADLEHFRGENLILAFCTECRRRWYFSWDLKDDAFHAVPIGDELFATLNLDMTLPRLVAFLLSPEYKYWNWAVEGWFDRFFRLSGADLETAAVSLRRALETPDLRGDVDASIRRRLARVLDLQAVRAREARPRRRQKPTT